MHSSDESTPLLQRAPPLTTCNASREKHENPPGSDCHKKQLSGFLENATRVPVECGTCSENLRSTELVTSLSNAVERGTAPVIREFRNASAFISRDRGVEPRIVLTVFAMAVATMATMTTIAPTLMVYLNHRGFTSAMDVSFYVTTTAVSSSVPIVSNILIGMAATRFGPGRALAFGAVVAASGLLIVICSGHSRGLFLLGFAVYSIANSFRVIRVGIITEVVRPEERTMVMAGHALMTPLGALVGPILWILIQKHRGNIKLAGPLPNINRFTVDYLLAATILLGIGAVALVMLGHIDGVKSDAEKGQSGSSSTEADIELASSSPGESRNRLVTIHDSGGADHVVDLDVYKAHIFRYFCGIMLGVNLSAGIFLTAFQPVLVNLFQASDAKMGAIFELIAALAVIPPVMIAVLSRYLMDREIMMIGLLIKIVGMALFLPLFGQVREWQVITGFMLVIKASLFFSTASMSLMTKLLGSLSSSTLLGFLSSASNIGPAAAQIALSGRILQLFGSFQFGLFGVPALLSMAAVAHPWYWKRLDASREFSRLVVAEAAVSQEHP